jgi:phosphomannomutase
LLQNLGFLYISNKKAEEGKIGAEELAIHTINKDKIITNKDLLKWTVVALDILMQQ